MKQHWQLQCCAGLEKFDVARIVDGSSPFVFTKSPRPCIDITPEDTNVAIALLGGPKQVSSAIHQRDKSFRNITVNRYILADINSTGDNTASPMALATLYHKISGNQIDGVSTEALEEIRNILLYRDYLNQAKLYRKGGSLHSHPVTSVAAGWFQNGNKTMDFAIMCSQSLRTVDSGKSQYTELAKLSRLIFNSLESAFLDQ